MNLMQLNPPIPMKSPKGEGLAILVIDYGIDYDLYFTIMINETGEIWTFNNKELRAVKNITIGRTLC